MKYMSIWAPKQRRVVKKSTSVDQGTRLPRRVKDWPADAALAFKDVKNQLWKHAKKTGMDKTGLALLAYQGVKEAFEGTPEVPVIHCKTEEETWEEMKKLSTT